MVRLKPLPPLGACQAYLQFARREGFGDNNHMRTRLFVCLAAALLVAGCGKKDTTATAQATNEPAGPNALTAPVDYLGAVGQAKKHSEKVIDTAALNQTIMLFNAQEERYPKDLNELVTMKYLPSVPKPPYGMKFEYNARSGTLKVVKAQ